MNNKIESLKKELKDAYVDGYVAETYAAQDAREDLLSFAVDVIADLFHERLDKEEVAESTNFFNKLMQRQYFLTPRSVRHDKAIHAFMQKKKRYRYHAGFCLRKKMRKSNRWKTVFIHYARFTNAYYPC